MRGSLSQVRRALRRDEGVSAILIALFVAFVLLPLAAVSVDLSNDYSNRRQMQNVADLASKAGVQQMWDMIGGKTGSVETVAEDVAKDNGMASITDSTFKCWVETIQYPLPDALPLPSAPYTPDETCAQFDAAPSASYNAVTVWASRDVATFFAKALPGGGESSTSASAEATAAIQGVSGGWAPFAACSSGTDDPSLLLQQSDGSYEVNEAAIGSQYTIWGTGSYTTSKNFDNCDMGKTSDFNGRLCPANASSSTSDTLSCQVNVPGTASFAPGTITGPTVTLVDGTSGCPSSDLTIKANQVLNFAPCTVALPICYFGDQSTKTLQCATWGSFLLEPATDGKAILGTFEGAAEISNGTPTSGQVSPGDAYRVALVQ